MSKLKVLNVPQLECQRCHRRFYPMVTVDGEIKETTRCRFRDCSSPYWNHPRVRTNDYWAQLDPKRYKTPRVKKEKI